ncbi:pentatricopeptide repeat-containing protein At1g22830-like [Nymphaea colorata]|uniref:pentatricopeptide repeat-containing protein At1g22830-like n=1 Tax=Nymphaea colorata TaxID=210225 RepID=UPI00214E6BF6|nr:pentatricopeptide repeat-containing protein At1g22830-like [Nymphaea colorata]
MEKKEQQMSSTILRSLVSQPPNSNVSRCVFLLQSCASNGAVNRGQQAHSWIIISGLQQIPFLVTSLINMYTRSATSHGKLSRFSVTQLNRMCSWNALIAGLVHDHYFSVGFYHEINASHVRGDKFTYPCVLKAWTNLQDPWEDYARQLFDKMIERDVVLWNSMNSGYAQRCRLLKLWRCFG